jgi:DNA-binding MarR family transcriptional regulator
MIAHVGEARASGFFTARDEIARCPAMAHRGDTIATRYLGTIYTFGVPPRRRATPRSAAAIDYATLADLRYRLRQFERTREVAVRAAGMAPQQYLLLLQVKGLEGRRPATIGTLAERLQLAHHSTVELVDRLVRGGMLVRSRGDQDRRLVTVVLRPAARRMLQRLATYSLAELQSDGPALVAALRRLIRAGGGSNGTR